MTSLSPEMLQQFRDQLISEHRKFQENNAGNDPEVIAMHSITYDAVGRSFMNDFIAEYCPRTVVISNDFVPKGYMIFARDFPLSSLERYEMNYLKRGI